MIGLRGQVVVVEVRFGNAIDARGCGNRARIAEASGDHVFADHACLKRSQTLVRPSSRMQAEFDIGVSSQRE